MTHIALKTVAAFVILVLPGLTWGDPEHLFRIQGKKLLTSYQERSPDDIVGFKSDVSRKNLLGLERESFYSLPRFSKISSSAVQTLKILSIRVEFQEENPDDPRTTGNGLFDMRSQDEFQQSEGHLIDPSPHDTLYFQKHLLALHNYWHTVSGGKLSLEGDVLPRSGNLAYRLPFPMVHYGAPDSSLDVKIEMLRQFFHDSFNLADSFSVYGDSQIYHIDFSRYDCYMIFHAGADLQSDLGELVNPTPGDLFTGFITLGDTVWVNDGTFPITEGTFMPEARSQDNRITALNGVFAHEFGHQLGLVDLYNSQNFMTQVGDFSLMDNNAQNIGVDVGYGVFVSGVLPVYPDAWSRAYLGFVEPVEIKSQNDIRLYAAEMLTGDLQAIKIPITPEEYFLLENREVDLDKDHFSGLRADSATNVILGPVDMNRQYNREYDWLLPGSGVLIWHVDEGVAYLDYDDDGLNNFWDNDLQADKNRRFVSIVEADGIIDFGGDYYTGYGEKEDIFFQGNNTEFTPHTFPASKSNNKSHTHIWITGISIADTVMTLDINQEWTQAGFPQKFTPETGASSPVYGDVNLDGNIETFISSKGFIHAWGPAGAGFFPNPDSVVITRFDSTERTLPLAIFAEEDSAFFGPPSLGDLDGDDTLEVVAATVDGRLFAWHPYDRDFDRRADVLNGFPVQLGERISMFPIVTDFDGTHADLEILIGGENGKTKVLDQHGLVKFEKTHSGAIKGLAMGDSLGAFYLLREYQNRGYVSRESFTNPPMPPFSLAEIPSLDNSSPVTGDINRDGSLEVIAVGGDGKIYAWDSFLYPLNGFPVETNTAMPRANPVLGDLNGDGFLEIIVAYQDKVFAYGFNGASLADFPVTINYPDGPTDLIVSSPVIGDADGDSYPDIIFGTKDKRVLAYNKDGRMVDGFPLAVNGTITSSPIFLNLDTDDSSYYLPPYANMNFEFPELLAASNDGFIYSWQIGFRGNFEPMNNPWTMFGYDAGHTNHFPKEKQKPVPPITGDLLPSKMAFNYPNPAKDQTKIRYFLKQNADVDIKIYDLSGMLVDEFAGPGEGRTHNERIWDCSKYASGVYLCRVEAKSEGDDQVVIFKIALVK